MPESATPAAVPGVPAPAQTQQPPMGVSPATGPTPNKGYEAAAMQRVGLLLKQATDILPMAGATSDIGKDLLKVINILSKHIPPGAVTPAAEKNNIERMAMQNAQQSQTMKSMQPGGQPGAGQQPPMAA